MQLPPKVLEQVKPQDMRNYANTHGWERMHSKRDSLALFRSATNASSRVQLVVPMRPDFDDYARQVADVVATLAEIEDRSPLAVLNDLLAPDVDVVRYSLRSRDTDTGQISLLQAVQALEGIKRSLLSAAHSVIVPQRHHPSLNRTEAKHFVDACKLAQTEHGSYTVAVACPIFDRDGYGEQITGEPPFGRMATTLLMCSTARLVYAIEQDRVEDMLDVEDDSEPIVSANLCDALLSIQPDEEGGSLALSMTWSSLLAPADSVPKAPVVIRAEHISTIRRLSIRLRPSDQGRRDLYFGHVVSLNGDADHAGVVSGEVTIQLHEGEENILVRLSLDSQDYETALKAHGGHCGVKFQGHLRRGARVHRVDHVSGFDMIK